VAHLTRGDLLPRIVHPPPGPASRRLSRLSARFEAPGINALDADGITLVWEEARGANVLDSDGNRYIDLTSGFGAAAVGHRHPRVVAAVRHQAGRLLHGLADVHSHPLRVRLARELARRAPLDRPQIYFAVSGADAVEVALKTALLVTGRGGVLAFEPAYHGLTLGALQVTSRAEFRHPFAAHFHPGVFRLPFGCPLAEIDAALDLQPGVGCAIVEPVVGREGVLLPPKGWLQNLLACCRRQRVLLIVDEIFTGFGRTGRWFVVDEEGVIPDLLCCGKALGGGLPIAAVIGSPELMSAWQSPGEALHTGTFVAHPLACAAALAVLDVLADERLPQRAARLGRRVERRLAGWAKRFVEVIDFRGRGLLWALELASPDLAHQITARILRRGILLLVGGPAGCVLEIVPPLVITERQLDFSLDAIESVLAGS